MAKLKQICQSKLNLKILSFFHQHSGAIDTPRGLAAWLNHDCDEVKKALEELAEQGVLLAHKMRATAAYGLTQNKKTIKELEKILANQIGR